MRTTHTHTHVQFNKQYRHLDGGYIISYAEGVRDDSDFSMAIEAIEKYQERQIIMACKISEDLPDIFPQVMEIEEVSPIPSNGWINVSV
jgi:hypothetical protein